MKRITISEGVGDYESERGPAEVCAVAEAAFDEAQSRLIVQLDSYLRIASFDAPQELFSESWLPSHEVLRESVSFEDASALTREIFQKWVQ